MVSIEDFCKKIEEWVVAHTGIDHTYNSVKASIEDMKSRFVENHIAPTIVGIHAEVVPTPEVVAENAPAPVPESQESVTNEEIVQPEVVQA